MGTSGTIVFELKMAVDIVLAEDGNYLRGLSNAKNGVVENWTGGPFEREAKACNSLQWQFLVPVIEKLQT